GVFAVRPRGRRVGGGCLVVAGAVAVAVAFVPVPAVETLCGGGDGARVGARVMIDRQQRVHGAGDGDERPLDLPAGREGRDIRADVRERQPADVIVGAGSARLGGVGGSG